jgi:hypothetical protein
MRVELKIFLSVAVIVGLGIWLWPYKGILLALVVLALFSIAGYHEGKMRRR